jgi:hypothetical protein
MAGLLCSCLAKTNPNYDDGETASSTSVGTSVGSSSTSTELSASASTGGGSGVTASTTMAEGPTQLLLFVTEPTNGSTDAPNDSEIEGPAGAALECEEIVTRDGLPCLSPPRAFLFVDSGVAPADAASALGVHDSLPISTPGGIVLADNVEDFVLGPLSQPLDSAGVTTSLYVWTGLDPAAPNNCEGWTTSTDPVVGGLGLVAGVDGGQAGWVAAGAGDCAEEYPVLCLCDA